MGLCGDVRRFLTVTSSVRMALFSFAVSEHSFKRKKRTFKLTRSRCLVGKEKSLERRGAEPAGSAVADRCSRRGDEDVRFRPNHG